MKPSLVLDFDNTLYDWVAQWHASFAAMLAEIVRISGMPESIIKAEARAIHQRHHTSEYAFLLEELPSLQGQSNIQDKYNSAIEAYRKARRNSLHLYPGVHNTLLKLKQKGYNLVVFTESQTFYTIMRFKKLGLDGLIDTLFTSQDHEVDEEFIKKIRSYPQNHYRLENTKHKALKKGRLKPDPNILINIINESNLSKENTLYVGDSLFKDIAMANEAGLTSVWAKYGESRSSTGYELLRDVSHWTDEDVAIDRSMSMADKIPNFVLESGFDEILGILKDRPWTA